MEEGLSILLAMVLGGAATNIYYENVVKDKTDDIYAVLWHFC